MPQFDTFVIFAEMRTGSNFLEANLNAIAGITCHGEAFNPAFIGYPNKTELLGITESQRNESPQSVLKAVRKAPGLNGFRFFHDHDPRVLQDLLQDRKCAKIILTRNPAESYVSWKIAKATGQWKLTNVRNRKDSKAAFDADEFETHLSTLQEFQITLMNALQVSGQTAFYVDNEDLSNLDVMNGLAKWLGVQGRLDSLNTSIKRQNPEPLEQKVANPDEMAQALARLDRFNLTRTPNFEPRRGAVVPSYVAATRAPLLYMPIQSGPTDAVRAWLAALDGVPVEELTTKFSQKSLRAWMAGHGGHRAFSVLRHPLARAHAAFCNHILHTGPGAMIRIRRTLRRAHDLSIPEDGPDATYHLAAHRAAFAQWLRFLRANLSGQTGVRVDGHWASQVQVLQGMSGFMLPDLLLREDEMADALPALAAKVGRPDAVVPKPTAGDEPFALADIYDDELEQLAREAYARDYVMFGFSDWSPPVQAA